MSALLEAAIASGTNSTVVGEPHLSGALQALATLALLAAAFWLVWRLRRAGSPGSLGNGRLHIEERVRLDLRSALLVVRVDDRRLLLATSEHGPARLITELASGASSEAAASGGAGRASAAERA